MPFISVRDIELYYEIKGRGPRLVFISGTGHDLRISPNAFTYPLVERFTVLGFDQRGMGRSGKPDVPYTMADYAADAAALMAALGWNEAAVMGVSFGGMVAQELALRHPERVSRLILCCCASGGAGGSSYPLHELVDLPPEERTARFIELTDSRLDKTWQAAHPEEFKALIDKTLADVALTSAEPGWAVGARRQLKARQGHDTYDRLPRITAPTFVCGGRYDLIVTEERLRTLAERIPNARLEMFAGGHLTFLEEDPRAFERIFAFLSGELDG